MALPLVAAVPITSAHERYLERGIVAIVHWGPNTYAGQERGFGNIKPEIVQPTDLNPAQWVKAMKAGGIRSVVLVAKHHDGFCLWPSAYTPDYSTAAIPGRFRNVNVVKAVERACRQEGLGFGVHLSAWDRHHGSYGQPEYVTYFHRQWAEMFSGMYGDLCEIWLDGVNSGEGRYGGDGWYGGVKGDKGEQRSVPSGYYKKPELLKSLVRHNPKGVAFGGYGENSVAWCGNERGFSPDDWTYERKGDDGKMYFMPPEADTPLRDGWFFHDEQHPKSLRQMVDCYFESVGHGGVLNWGIAPDKTGRVCDEDVKRLKEFGDYVRNFNAVNLAKGASLSKTVDGKEDVIVFNLSAPVAFNAVDFGEDLTKGQLAEEWRVSVYLNNTWKTVARGTTVGYRRIARFDAVKSDRVRIACRGFEKRPKIVRPAVRYAPTVRDTGEVEHAAIDTAKGMSGKERRKK